MLNKVANRIPELLESAKMTQSELARLSGLQDAQLNKIIRGVNVPRIDTAFKICRGLKKSIDKVFYFEPGQAA